MARIPGDVDRFCRLDRGGYTWGTVLEYRPNLGQKVPVQTVDGEWRYPRVTAIQTPCTVAGRQYWICALASRTIDVLTDRIEALEAQVRELQAAKARRWRLFK